MDLSNAVLTKISVHQVGNKGVGQDMVLTKKPLDLSEQERNVIGKAFLSRFTLEENLYAFHHESSLDYNEVYNYCLDSFAEGKNFHKTSQNIAKHLFESSNHPKIKPGEIYICHFNNCSIDGAFAEGIGIFKAESRAAFFDIQLNGKEINLSLKEGVDVTKLDKSALVFETNAESGFDVLIVDNKKGEDAVFWKEAFLNIVPRATEYYQTKEFLTLTRDFISKQIPQDFQIERADQIDLLNKSVDYFQTNEAFSKKDFEKKVLQDTDYIKAFRQYETSYSETHDIEIADNFEISNFAVKKQARIFKSVLKLDTNFHVYIHGDRNLIEKGYDNKLQKNFYKIYFDEER